MHPHSAKHGKYHSVFMYVQPLELWLHVRLRAYIWGCPSHCGGNAMIDRTPSVVSAGAD